MDRKYFDFFLLIVVVTEQNLIRAENINCNGKAFYCVDETYFKICVDFGQGVSTTVDDVVLPCPQGTVCRATNNFECEIVPSTTPINEIYTSDVTNETESKYISLSSFFPNLPFEANEIEVTVNFNNTAKDGHLIRDSSLITADNNIYNDITSTTNAADIYTNSATTDNPVIEPLEFSFQNQNLPELAGNSNIDFQDSLINRKNETFIQMLEFNNNTTHKTKNKSDNNYTNQTQTSSITTTEFYQKEQSKYTDSKSTYNTSDEQNYGQPRTTDIPEYFSLTSPFDTTTGSKNLLDTIGDISTNKEPLESTTVFISGNSTLHLGALNENTSIITGMSTPPVDKTTTEFQDVSSDSYLFPTLTERKKDLDNFVTVESETTTVAVEFTIELNDTLNNFRDSSATLEQSSIQLINSYTTPITASTIKDDNFKNFKTKLDTEITTVPVGTFGETGDDLNSAYNILRDKVTSESNNIAKNISNISLLPIVNTINNSKNMMDAVISAVHIDAQKESKDILYNTYEVPTDRNALGNTILQVIDSNLSPITTGSNLNDVTKGIDLETTTLTFETPRESKINFNDSYDASKNITAAQNNYSFGDFTGKIEATMGTDFVDTLAEFGNVLNNSYNYSTNEGVLETTSILVKDRNMATLTATPSNSDFDFITSNNLEVTNKAVGILEETNYKINNSPDVSINTATLGYGNSQDVNSNISPFTITTQRDNYYDDFTKSVDSEIATLTVDFLTNKTLMSEHENLNDLLRNKSEINRSDITSLREPKDTLKTFHEVTTTTSTIGNTNTQLINSNIVNLLITTEKYINLDDFTNSETIALSTNTPGELKDIINSPYVTSASLEKSNIQKINSYNMPLTTTTLRDGHFNDFETKSGTEITAIPVSTLAVSEKFLQNNYDIAPYEALTSKYNLLEDFKRMIIDSEMTTTAIEAPKKIEDILKNSNDNSTKQYMLDNSNVQILESNTTPLNAYTPRNTNLDDFTKSTGLKITTSITETPGIKEDILNNSNVIVINKTATLTSENIDDHTININKSETISVGVDIPRELNDTLNNILDVLTNKTSLRNTVTQVIDTNILPLPITTQRNNNSEGFTKNAASEITNVTVDTFEELKKAFKNFYNTSTNEPLSKYGVVDDFSTMFPETTTLAVDTPTELHYSSDDLLKKKYLEEFNVQVKDTTSPSTINTSKQDNLTKTVKSNFNTIPDLEKINLGLKIGTEINQSTIEKEFTTIQSPYQNEIRTPIVHEKTTSNAHKINSDVYINGTNDVNLKNSSLVTRLLSQTQIVPSDVAIKETNNMRSKQATVHSIDFPDENNKTKKETITSTVSTLDTYDTPLNMSSFLLLPFYDKEIKAQRDSFTTYNTPYKVITVNTVDIQKEANLSNSNDKTSFERSTVSDLNTQKNETKLSNIASNALNTNILQTKLLSKANQIETTSTHEMVSQDFGSSKNLLGNLFLQNIKPHLEKDFGKTPASDNFSVTIPFDERTTASHHLDIYNTNKSTPSVLSTLVDNKETTNFMPELYKNDLPHLQSTVPTLIIENTNLTLNDRKPVKFTYDAKISNKLTSVFKAALTENNINNTSQTYNKLNKLHVTSPMIFENSDKIIEYDDNRQAQHNFSYITPLQERQGVNQSFSSISLTQGEPVLKNKTIEEAVPLFIKSDGSKHINKASGINSKHTVTKSMTNQTKTLVESLNNVVHYNQDNETKTNVNFNYFVSNTTKLDTFLAETTNRNKVGNEKTKTNFEENSTNIFWDNLKSKSNITRKILYEQNISKSFDCSHNPRGRYANNQSCKLFYICIGPSQDPVLGACPEYTVFSAVKKQCTKNLSHCIVNNQFQCTSSGKYSDIFREDVYYICVRGRDNHFVKFKFQCQNNFYLNKTTMICTPRIKIVIESKTDSYLIDLKNNLSVSKSEQSQSLSISKENNYFECEKEGKFPDTTDCRSYYECRKKHSEFRRKRKQCDSDEVFHRERNKCVDAESYECN